MHVAAVVGGSVGLAVLNGNGAVHICAVHVYGEVQIVESVPVRGPFSESMKEQGPTSMIL